MSRLHPNTTAQQVKDFILFHFQVDVIVNKMKTKYDTYASFLLTLESDQADRIIGSATWPNNTLVKRFKPRYHNANTSIQILVKMLGIIITQTDSN